MKDEKKIIRLAKNLHDNSTEEASEFVAANLTLFDRWFSFSYEKRNISEEYMNRFRSYPVQKGFSLPRQNKYIPSNLDLLY